MHHLKKIGDDFNIDDWKGKRTSTDENCLYNPFEHFWFKSAFDPENYGFESVVLINVVQIYVIKGMNA